jgi:hypothetical protein
MYLCIDSSVPPGSPPSLQERLTGEKGRATIILDVMLSIDNPSRLSCVLCAPAQRLTLAASRERAVRSVPFAENYTSCNTISTTTTRDCRYAEQDNMC